MLDDGAVNFSGFVMAQIVSTRIFGLSQEVCPGSRDARSVRRWRGLEENVSKLFRP